MKRLASLILLSLLVVGCGGGGVRDTGPKTDAAYFDSKMEELAQGLVENSTKKINKAAVLDFKNPNGRTSQLGKYLSSKFSVVAIKNRYFSLPSQGQVSDALANEGIEYKGSLDKASASKLGKALGVDGFIVGEISDLQKGSDIDVIVKIIEARSGNVVSASNVSLYRSKSVSSLLQNF